MMFYRYKLLKTAFLVFTLVSIAFVGWTYGSIRLPDHNWPLIRHSLASDTGWLTRKFVDHEIERRISAGQEDGVAFLIDILIIGRADEATRVLAELKATSLIEGIVDINSHDQGGYTPSHIAIATNDASLLQWLLENGADPSIATELGSDAADELDAFEYLEFVEQQPIHEDMTDVSEVLYGRSTVL